MTLEPAPWTENPQCLHPRGRRHLHPATSQPPPKPPKPANLYNFINHPTNWRGEHSKTLCSLRQTFKHRQDTHMDQPTNPEPETPATYRTKSA